MIVLHLSDFVELHSLQSVWFGRNLKYVFLGIKIFLLELYPKQNAFSNLFIYHFGHFFIFKIFLKHRFVHIIHNERHFCFTPFFWHFYSLNLFEFIFSFLFFKWSTYTLFKTSKGTFCMIFPLRLTCLAVFGSFPRQKRNFEGSICWLKTPEHDVNTNIFFDNAKAFHLLSI